MTLKLKLCEGIQPHPRNENSSRGLVSYMSTYVPPQYILDRAWTCVEMPSVFFQLEEIIHAHDATMSCYPTRSKQYAIRFRDYPRASIEFMESERNKALLTFLKIVNRMLSLRNTEKYYTTSEIDELLTPLW